MIGVSDWTTWARKLFVQIRSQGFRFVRNILGQLMRRVGIGISFGPSTTEKDLFYFAVLGDLEGVARVLAMDAGAVSGRINGATALHFAAQEGHADVVRMLLNSGASVKDLHSESGQTPLLIAADRGHNEVCLLLLAQGSNVEEKTSLVGHTALHMAAMAGNNELVKTLLAHGAAVDGDDISKSTALHLACQEGHLPCVLTLIKANASVTLPDNQGQCAIHVASRRNRDAVILAILDHGCPTDLVS